MTTTPNDGTAANPRKNRNREQDYSPEPVEAFVRCTLRWFHGFHLHRERPKITDWLTVGLTLLAAVAAICSAFIFQHQLTVARQTMQESTESFRIDERAWIEIEPIKPIMLNPENAKFPALFTCNIYPKNVGKTVARDITVKAQDLGSMEDFGNNAESMRNAQDRMLLNGFKEMGTNNSVVVPANPVPKVLAPNTVSPVPFRMTCEAPQVFPSGHQAIHYMVGRIDYCDQFQIKHWLKFCFYVANARGEIWACQEGNDEDRNTEAQTPQVACANPN